MGLTCCTQRGKQDEGAGIISRDLEFSEEAERRSKVQAHHEAKLATDKDAAEKARKEAEHRQKMERQKVVAPVVPKRKKKAVTRRELMEEEQLQAMLDAERRAYEDSKQQRQEALKLQYEESLDKLEPRYRAKITDGKRIEFLADDKAGDQVAEVLALALQQDGCVIEYVAFDMTSLTDKGAIMIAEALYKNISLTQLKMSASSKITDATCEKLAAAMEENDTLEALFLNDTEVTDKGAQYLYDTIEDDPTDCFQILSLIMTKVTPPMKAKFESLQGGHPDFTCY